MLIEPHTNQKEATRLASLNNHGLLDSLPEPEFDRVTQLASRLLGKPISLLSLVDKDRQFFKSAHGLSAPLSDKRETPLTHSFCQHVVAHDEPFVVEDARNHPVVKNNLAVRDLGVVSYLGVPVHGTDGETHGALCVIGSKPYKWSDGDIQTLSDLAEIIETEFVLREKLRQADIVAREYHHRVKNSLAVASSLISLSGKESSSVQETVTTARRRLMSLSNAHNILLSHSGSISLEKITVDLLSPYASEENLKVGGPAITLTPDQVTPICFLLHELATNSAKYGAFSDEGEIYVSWSLSSDDMIWLVWTEKSERITSQGKTGFGNDLIVMASLQLDGSLKSNWEEGQLTVSMEFPSKMRSIDAPSLS